MTKYLFKFYFQSQIETNLNGPSAYSILEL